MSNDKIYCDNCGCETHHTNVYAIASLPKDIASAKFGESAQVCPSCYLAISRDEVRILKEQVDEARQIACFLYAQSKLSDDLEADVADRYRQDLEEFYAALQGWDCWKGVEPFVGDDDHRDYPYPAGNTDG